MSLSGEATLNTLAATRCGRCAQLSDIGKCGNLQNGGILDTSKCMICGLPLDVDSLIQYPMKDRFKVHDISESELRSWLDADSQWRHQVASDSLGIITGRRWRWAAGVLKPNVESLRNTRPRPRYRISVKTPADEIER